METLNAFIIITLVIVSPLGIRTLDIVILWIS